MKFSSLVSRFSMLRILTCLEAASSTVPRVHGSLTSQGNWNKVSQFKYKITFGRSRNHCCRGKGISIIYSE